MYTHGDIDKKWQQRWEDSGIFHAKEDASLEKYYLLVEFPYPSGAGLHVGHPRSYTALDILARKRRMEGKNVLFPMGWDAFGLPAENYAIKTGEHPSRITKENIATFRRQLQSLGFSFDWSREVDTTDPKYYRWTQWMFLEFFKHGLCYKAKMPINWCPKCKIGLANEEAAGGVCERCGSPVEKREKEQWMLAMTKYADRLLEDLQHNDYLPKIKKEQEEWIGRSEGAEIDFELFFAKNPSANDHRGPHGEKAKLSVFTTRPDTLYGVTYVVLAPEHPWVSLALQEGRDVLENEQEIREYIAAIQGRTDDERTAVGREKTGVPLKGVFAVHPLTGEKLPLWIADYVLPQYGTGVVMAVPAHDERDFLFAKKYQLPIIPVVAAYIPEPENPPKEGVATIRRRNAQAIVRRERDGAILLLSWKKNQRKDGSFPQTFIVGGIEEGEDAVAAMLREIQEETGLTSVRYEETLPLAVHCEYFAGHKGENRYAEEEVLCFVAEGDEPFSYSAEEATKHEPIWVSPDEIRDRVKVVDGAYVWKYLEQPFAMVDDGVMVNSREVNGMRTQDAKSAMIALLERLGCGRSRVTYRLRDWVFSRQRYWGEPIPLVRCLGSCSPETEGWVPVPEKDLPVTLPQVEKYEPTDTGESPLSTMTDWVNTTCPQCSGAAVRETDTMPNWAGSSWYFLRYIDPKNDEAFARKDLLSYWLPVDLYNGGMEHATRHLLYARFWTKVLYDRGHIPCTEFAKRRIAHGLILGEDGQKMSKSKGNVVNPDDIVREYGADTLRMYEVFMGPFEEAVPWSTQGVVGVRRFLDRVMRFADCVTDEASDDVLREAHRALEKVSSDCEGLRFNTAVAALMTCANVFTSAKSIPRDALVIFLQALVPFAPHVANEVWERIGGKGFVEEQPWPSVRHDLLQSTVVTYAIQVNGKMRGTLEVSEELSQEELFSRASAQENIAKYLTGQTPKKVIIIPGKMISIVV